MHARLARDVQGESLLRLVPRCKKPEDFLFNGSLQEGAILGLNMHTGIFVDYIRGKNDQILGIQYWDDTEKLREWRIGDSGGVRPTKAWNWGTECVDGAPAASTSPAH